MLKVIIILIFFSNILIAQDKESDVKTEEIKVVSSYGTNILNSPAHITLLDKNSVQRRNGTNLSDILKTVPGVFMKSYGSPNSLQTISINGLGPEHTVILLNGSKLNSLQNGQIDLSLIPAMSIKKIEVLNNGYCSLFGSEAMGGVVNIITDNSFNEKLKVNFNSAIGSYKTTELQLGFSGKLKKFSFDLSASKEKSDNDYSYYFDNGISKELRNRAGAGYDNSSYSVSSQYISNSSLYINYYSQIVSSKRDLPGIETGIPAPSASQNDKNWNNILQFNYTHKNYSVTSDFNFQNNLMNYKTSSVINSYYKNILLSNSSRVEINSGKNSYTFGGELKYGTLYSNELVSGINRKHYSIFNSTSLNWKNLFVYPSLRYDYVTDLKKGAVTYRLGVNYKPLEKIDLHLRANAGRNFRVPTFNDLYWKEGGNTNLKPEYSQNYETGIVFHGSSFSSFEYTIDLSYTNVNLKDRIVWIPHRNSIWSPENIASSKSNIFTLATQLQYNFKKDFYIHGELSYTENSSKKISEDFSQDPTTNKQVIYIPLNQVQSNLEFKAGFAGLNLFYSYIGKRFSDSENLYSLPAVNLLDGNIFFETKIAKYTAEIKFEVNNITNSDYQIIAGYPVPLRNFKIKLNLSYSL